MQIREETVAEVVVNRQGELSVTDVVQSARAIILEDLGKYIKMSILPYCGFFVSWVLFFLRDYSGYFIACGIGLLIVSGWYYVRFRVRGYRHMLLDENAGELDPKVERGLIWDYIGNVILMRVYSGFVSALLCIVPVALGYGLHEQLGPEGKRVLVGIFNKEVLQTLLPLLGLAFLADKATLVFPDVAVGGPAAYARLEQFAKHARLRIILIMSAIWALYAMMECALPIMREFAGEILNELEYPLAMVGLLVGYATNLWSMGAEAVLYKRLVMDAEAGESDGAAQGVEA